MATKTYLQLVNKVLGLLREAQVPAVSGDYALLIGEYVNQAKEKVENAWKWRALQMTYVIPNVSRTSSLVSGGPISPVPSRYPDERAYLLRDKRSRPLVFDSTIPTNTYQLREYTTPQGIYNDLPGAGATFTNIPDGFYFVAGQSPSLILTQTPNPSRSITLVMVVPQDEFTLGTETLLVPWRPVVSLAYALANDERGEELGQDGQLLFNKANDDLAVAIGRDIDGTDFEMVPD